MNERILLLSKTLETLPQDIYDLFNPDEDHEVSEDNLETFSQNLKEVLRSRLRRYTPPVSPLRFSSLGKPDRQIWYDAHPVVGTKEALVPKTYMKFLYGDIIEQLLLFLTVEAGHTVTSPQAEVEVLGVKGHIDAIIDGVVVDVKSASPYGFAKFKNNSITEDDPFGYVAQLSGYSSVLTPGAPAAWLANDKVAGDICVTPLSAMVIKHNLPAPRITHLKEMVANDEAPAKCYEDISDGKSGNRKLSTACSYCAHKFRCWDGLRGFVYSTGPRYLTQVDRVPDVPEISL